MRCAASRRLAVVFWHWQHFFFLGDRADPSFVRAAQPAYSTFFLLYQSGSLAVDLFFSISGFIFYRLYAEAIHSRRVPAARFFILRLSRLYPLHLVTLLVVAAGQILHVALHGAPFVYPFNDVRHFVLNLVMLTSVGLERGNSFNAPFWSVSVEVVLYAVFFTISLATPRRALVPLTLSLLGFFAFTDVNAAVARGAGSFFLGGVVFLVHRRLTRSKHLPTATFTVALVTAFAWVLTVWMSYRQLSLESGTWLERTSFTYAAGVLFPLTILTAVFLEPGHRWFRSIATVLGNLSYSSYLWHFPLQLMMVLLLPVFGLTREWFLSKTALGVFLATLIAVALASHRYLETPARHWIRRRFLRAPIERYPGEASA